MVDNSIPLVPDDIYRTVLSPDDRELYDRTDPEPELTREVRALRLVLYKLIHDPLDHSREIVAVVNTLCRVISTEARRASDDGNADITAELGAGVLEFLREEME